MFNLNDFLATTIANAPRPAQGPLTFQELARVQATGDRTGADCTQEIRESWIRGFQTWG